jgi:hypothetical protein
MVAEIGKNNMGLVVVITVMFVLVVYVLFYVRKIYNSSSLKTITMLPDAPMSISHITPLTNISSGVKLPLMNNGGEFSYSFWIYISQFSGGVKHVISRQSSAGDVTKNNPKFILGESQNSLSVVFDCTTTTGVADPPPQLKINYIPMQRWVNILTVTDNNFIQLFMDGELREVKDTSVPLGESCSISRTEGDIIVGGPESFVGYLCRVQCFNYALTLDHAKILYKAGPLKQSFLTTIGIPNYGLQSPIYRIDEVTGVADVGTVGTIVPAIAPVIAPANNSGISSGTTLPR